MNPALLDLTEIPGTDNLHYPEGPIMEAQRLAAEVFLAEETFFLVNGSTGGIHAMIMAVCRPGDKLIVERDCHKSAIGGMILGGVTPVYIKPGYNGYFGISTGITPEQVDEALRKNPDAAGVLLTRPNYYGLCSDIEGIARTVHSHGKVLMVDEAHGAHLRFHEGLPISAMEAGADVCVQSAHKTLPALTQSSYLHVKSGRVDRDRLKFYLRTLQTSSPSYILLSYLDIAREIMAQEGRALLDKLVDTIHGFKTETERNGLLSLLGEDAARPAALDKTRVVINVRKAGITGFETEKLLRKNYNIQVEMSDYYNIVGIATVADQKEDFEKLQSALSEICRRMGHKPPLPDINLKGFEIPELKIGMRDVMEGKGTLVKLAEAAGRISLDMVTPYPPGIPVICPGEIISDGQVEYLSGLLDLGGVVNGLGKSREIKVLA